MYACCDNINNDSYIFFFVGNECDGSPAIKTNPKGELKDSRNPVKDLPSSQKKTGTYLSNKSVIYFQNKYIA
jgi:hypothetical protein